MAITGALAIAGARKIEITNLVVATPATEVSLVLQSNVKYIEIRARGKANTQFSFTATESGTKFFTIPKYTSYVMNGFSFSGETLYVQCDVATTLEIIELY